ncbi:tripartite tricarboxylate transporter TctB family protein [Petroclostridium sp. X23]|uniref:tripartite tricarboxylate transporter TctB family protein n=1 Tax=Petroclostridium sp. X23 TaxID=3045146 RepID=UPI0024AD1023|nr:tripartite tricarboxylate transporter TctB family protein [Petroclostridium sp. X23]WHH61018.1 tripartite tricarboxylate transporter TctB family protein [Petroclostridium sp. X23]
MMKRDTVLSIFFLLIGFFIWFAIPYQIEDTGITVMGPRFFPKVLSIMLVVVSGLFLVQNILAGKKQGKEKEDKGEIKDIKSELNVLILFALMIAYVYLMPIWGFIISTIVVIGAVVYFLGTRKWYMYLIFIAIVLLVYYVFQELLYVQLP